MAKDSLMDVYNRLNEQGAELMEHPAAAPMSPIHLQTFDALSHLMTLGRSTMDADTPAPVRMMLVGLEQARPFMLEQLGRIPADVLREFLRQGAAGLLHIAETPDPESESPDGRPQLEAGPSALPASDDLAGPDIATA